MPKKEKTTIFSNHAKRGFMKWGQDFRQGSKWRDTRNIYFRNQPLCEVHTHHGKTADGHEVDHIIPESMGGAKYRKENLMTLNNRIHWKKTAAENQKKHPLFEWKMTPHGKIPKNRDDVLEKLKRFMD